MASSGVGILRASEAASSADNVIELMELLYFGYREFTADPDALLEEFGFGRAHHRVLHFVGRNPGMSVAELLELLKITKQSLSRVLRELVDREFIEQREGNKDRRRRLLFLTPAGKSLHAKLMEPQIARLRAAVALTGNDSGADMRQFLVGLLDEKDREQVLRIVDR